MGGQSAIHAGGRGKGGGVKVVKSLEEVAKKPICMLGMTLSAHQTGPEGREVGPVEDGSDIARELYLSALVDRVTSRISFIAQPKAAWTLRKWRRRHRRKF